jgi:hypothetical protein
VETVSNGQHRGPTPHVIIKPEALAREKAARGNSGKKRNLTEAQKLELKRAGARAYYHANKKRIAKRTKEKYHRDKNLPVVSDEGSGEKPPMPKRPSKVDALVCINRSLAFLRQGDTDGAELWSLFAARIIEGKE